ncbi:NADPH:quinone oxidoreductase family protein [Tardiphaga sp. 866_E4_N2_1]|uniref:NADPH:quinone oxidoreductase family protein n=1 Tax=unclassified Tardiphaga TaxID=2631404 RepID=UPI003F287E19
MKALLSETAGGPDTLKLRDVPDPTPGDNGVVIRVAKCGVNFPDGLLIRDLYQIKPPRPFSPGAEVSGTVEAVGPQVSRFAVGDRVIGRSGWGGMAEKILLTEDRCIGIPDAMSFDHAAAFIFTYGTAHYALADRAHLQVNETILVLGASGGVGIAAIQVARAMGARVVAAASSQEKVDVAIAQGAQHGIVYMPGPLDGTAAKSLSAEIRKVVGPDGVDVVLDPVGGSYAEPSLRSISPNGRYLVVGFTAGIPKIPLNLVLLKSCQIVGVDWGAFVRRDLEGAEANAMAALKLYSGGKLQPVISARYSLSDAPVALALLEQRKVYGKIIIDVEGAS